MHLLSGLASVPEVDKSNHFVRLGALSWGNELPPLLFDHSEQHHYDQTKTVGRIHRLEWTPEGLAITALVDDNHADRKGFSCRFKVQDYEIVGEGERAYALVKRGLIREISLVDRPCCPSALVRSRQRHDAAPPFDQYRKAASDTFDAMIRAMSVMQHAISALRQNQSL
ncbi:hypothetical protein ACVDG8_002415 [Mesorhizobium sp. ORM8.1]